MAAKTVSLAVACRAAGSGAAQRAARAPARLMALLCLIGLASQAAQAESRVALVIGNAGYTFNPLKNPRHDAELMTRTLSGLGFEVLSVYDAAAPEMRKAVTDFGRRLQAPDTVALFYYAGHGVQADGENYLIPLGAGIANMNEVAINAISLSDVLKSMARSNTRMNIVILDACRDNPFAATSVTSSIETTRGLGTGGLAPAVAPSGTIIGYATAPGQVSRDGEGDHSPYTAALAASMPAPGLTVEDVFRNARRQVLDVTGGKQTPWEHSSLIGEFYFNRKSSDRFAGAPPGGTDPATQLRLSELEAWEKIKDITEAAVLKAHIARFPDGLFAELASVKIARLQTPGDIKPWESSVITGDIARDAAAEDAAVIYERAVKLDAAASTNDDRAKVTKLYGEAAMLGLPSAMYSYGRAYDNGRGVTKNLNEAARWYGLAADKNHTGAMAALGTMYEYGDGVKPDLAEAVRLYLLSSEAGDPAGLTSLGYLYAQGKGVARNPTEARRLYTLAVEKGHARAMYNLALMTLRGEGGRPNLSEAIKLLKQATEKGHAGATEELAELYDRGRGVTRSPKLAAEYIILAQKAAHRDGRKIDAGSRSWTFATKRELQRQLAGKGLYKGTIHGFFNDATRKALLAVAEN